MVKTRAAIYIRVSTKEQVMEGYSLDAQKRTLTDYCRSMNYEIHGIYSNEGISAKDIEHRPGIMALIKDAVDNKKENRSYIICPKLKKPQSNKPRGKFYFTYVFLL